MTDPKTMHPILVTSTEEATGKTAITLALATLAQDRGSTVGYFKPKGTRLKSPVGKTRDEDALLAKELLGMDETIAELEPVVYSPAFVEGALRGREDPGEISQRVRGHYDALAADYDTILVEGGGAMTTGGIVDLTDADVAELLDARAVLVARYDDPGDVDEVLAAADRLGDRLAGVVFNAVADSDYDSLSTDVVTYLDQRNVPVLGVIPRVQELAGVTIDELQTTLGAELLTPDVDTNGFIERFGVGAMGSDSALKYLRRLRDAAVVTGGDRSQIQTAAIEAPGVEVLVLTGGLRPSGAVIGKAADEGVPILLVQSDTKGTVDRVEEVLSTGRTRDEETVARMSELLSEYVDVDDLLNGTASG